MLINSNDVSSRILKLQSNDSKAGTLSSNSREDIVNKAKKMVEISWTPKKDLVGWRGNFIFAKGKTYKGIPYSQTEYQKDDTGFLESLNKNDFYDYYTRFGIRMPKYGRDCSAFVSFAWG
ncbi:hypothetical protein ELD05_04465 [Caldicellulosiruptor changbaiensis]|uniref:Uncharacterized protein n=1 Tax=Caldicellulosiruptor changbaiensis TaxID=1222016 RepID=A0A3T0D4J5_9FIRM|nr:hypothetical protein [Caldicellulosiruptor changbaiensis]AZT89964.1 hypothetical protein ELD05_04465 [Caldicellulosiruptor changbaiensis]